MAGVPKDGPNELPVFVENDFKTFILIHQDHLFESLPRPDPKSMPSIPPSMCPDPKWKSSDG